MSELVKSCFDCKAVCCKHGPGPHRSLPPEEYLENFGTEDAYNTKCMALSEDGKCTIWGTKDFPHVCRVHVCNQKIFTPQELKEISQVDDEYECPNCEVSWTRGYDKDGTFIRECEICGHKTEWKGKVVSRGKRI